MTPALPYVSDAASRGFASAEHSDTLETRLYVEEHEWLYGLLRSADNVSPTFRFPDLISACVSLACAGDDPEVRIFDYLGTQLVLRAPAAPRRRESMWRPQYELLQAIQRSPANRHPNPKFQLDQLTTACVALVRQRSDADAQVLRQARLNMADRSARWRLPRLA